MENNHKAVLPPKTGEDFDGKNNLEGYPLYPASEDIYKKSAYEVNIDPEEPTKVKPTNELPDMPNEKEFEDDVSGDDLDVPGSDLDDEQEKIGSEDEANNL